MGNPPQGSARDWRNTCWMVFILLGGLVLTAQAGVRTSIYPDPICALPGSDLQAFVWVDSAGSEFDGYEAVIRFDPAQLTFVSVDQESLMLDPPGNPWFWTEIGDSTVFISHVLLSGGVTITGPGALSSITFTASGSAPETGITFDYIEFYHAGLYVPDIIWHDGTVVIREDCTQAACCFDTGDCLVLTEEECLAESGVWRLYYESCDPNPCVPMDVPEGEKSGAIGWEPVWPHPVGGDLTLAYNLGCAERIRIEVLDLQGRHVRSVYEGPAPQGRSTASWDRRDDTGQVVAPGVYFLRLLSSRDAQAQRIVLVR